MRFGRGPGGAETPLLHYPPVTFGDHFPSKIEQMASSSAKGSPNAAKSQKKRRPKNDAKNDAEKDEKMIPKASKTMPKRTQNSLKKRCDLGTCDFSVFAESITLKCFFY